MALKVCAGCSIAFEPRPQTPQQEYCSLTNCQRLRRQRWQREKLQNDPDYQDNQSRSQRAWMDRNPDYLDFTRFCRQTSTSNLKLFKCQRAQLVKMTVPAHSIIKTLNIIKRV
jgi:hypothetical protein